MKTPFGAQCSYYYEDMHRGREHQECRLLDTNQSNWTVRLCKSCPVPRWQQCNSCEHLNYRALVTPGLLGFWRRMIIKVWYQDSHSEVIEPEVGCGSCHQENPFLEYLTH